MKEIYKYIGILLLITVLLIAINFLFYGKESKLSSSEYNLNIIKQQDSIYIYEVTVNKRLLIRQEYIPAVKGNQNFKSEEDALAIGNLVIEKLKKKKLPSVSVKDIIDNNIKTDNTL